MSHGFFPASMLLESKVPASLIPKCGACGLFKSCKTPKMEVTGSGKRKILVVGEAPSKTDDSRGRQFSGESGEYLSKILKQVDVSLERDCWMTNALICHPSGELEDKQIGYCQPNLSRSIKDLQPHTIILLGRAPVRSLLSSIWKEDVGPIAAWTGWQIPFRETNTWVCPTWNPAFVVNNKDMMLQFFFEKHIRAAASLQGRPWRTEPPSLDDQVEVIFDVDKAASIIRKMVSKGGVAAFDYETNMLKPEGQFAEILCCSISWEGQKTIAYPWRGRAKEATFEFLRSSNIKKIASNLKFEERWTRHEFGVGVRGWLWDTMLAAHVIDNRPLITSIKFQSFIHLGVPSYDEHIKPFLKTKTGVNRAAQEIEFKKLLHYNALDSLFEYLVAVQQMEHIGIP